MGEGHQATLGRRIGLAVRFGLPARVEAMLMMAPAALAVSAGNACLLHRKAPCSDDRRRCHSSQSMSCSREPCAPAMPALLTSPSMRPKRCRAVAMKSRTLASSVMSSAGMRRPHRVATRAGRPGRLPRPVADQHAATCTEHALGDATADAVGAAGDQHHLARQWRGRPSGNRRHRAHDRSSPRRRRCQPSTPIRSKVWMLRSTITSGSGNASTARATLSSRSRCRVGNGARLV